MWRRKKRQMEEKYEGWEKKNELEQKEEEEGRGGKTHGQTIVITRGTISGKYTPGDECPVFSA